MGKMIQLLLNIDENDLPRVMNILALNSIQFTAPYHTDAIRLDNDLEFSEWLQNTLINRPSLLRNLDINAIKNEIDIVVDMVKQGDDSQKLQPLIRGIAMIPGGIQYLRLRGLPIPTLFANNWTRTQGDVDIVYE